MRLPRSASRTVSEALTEWTKLIDWQALLVRVVAFPWRLDDPIIFARRSAQLEAMLLDRMRLLSRANPDGHLDDWARKEMATWCTARLKEFPRV